MIVSDCNAAKLIMNLLSYPNILGAQMILRSVFVWIEFRKKPCQNPKSGSGKAFGVSYIFIEMRFVNILVDTSNTAINSSEPASARKGLASAGISGTHGITELKPPSPQK